MTNNKFINPDIMKVAKNILAENKDEFTCIRIGKDPRTLQKPTWITVKEALEIYNKLECEIGISKTNVNYVDLDYAINRPIVDVVGTPKKSQFSRICECAYMISNYIPNRSAIQFSATIFLTLCKLNEFDMKFEVGEIYDIFIELYENQMTLEEFEQIMVKHLVSKVPQYIIPI